MLKDFVELVRDVNHADAALPQFVENAEKRFDFRVRQGGSRFVQHQDARIVRKRLGDFDQLLLADAEVPDGMRGSSGRCSSSSSFCARL